MALRFSIDPESRFGSNNVTDSPSWPILAVRPILECFIKITGREFAWAYR